MRHLVIGLSVLSVSFAEATVVFDIERSINASTILGGPLGSHEEYVNENLSHPDVTSGTFPTLSGSATNSQAPDYFSNWDSSQDVWITTAAGTSTVSGSGYSFGDSQVPESPPSRNADAWSGGSAWFPSSGNDVRVHFVLTEPTDYSLDVIINTQIDATSQYGFAGHAKVRISPYSDAFEQPITYGCYEYQESYLSSGNPIDTIHTSDTLGAGWWTLLVSVGSSAAAEWPGDASTDTSVRTEHSFDFTLHSTAVVPEPSALVIWGIFAVCGVGISWRRRKA